MLLLSLLIAAVGIAVGYALKAYNAKDSTILVVLGAFAIAFVASVIAAF